MQNNYLIFLGMQTTEESFLCREPTVARIWEGILQLDLYANCVPISI